MTPRHHYRLAHSMKRALDNYTNIPERHRLAAVDYRDALKQHRRAIGMESHFMTDREHALEHLSLAMRHAVDGMTGNEAMMYGDLLRSEKNKIMRKAWL